MCEQLDVGLGQIYKIFCSTLHMTVSGEQFNARRENINLLDIKYVPKTCTFKVYIMKTRNAYV